MYGGSHVYPRKTDLVVVYTHHRAHLTEDKWMPLKIVASLAVLGPLVAIELTCPDQAIEQVNRPFTIM